jgi:hypothetical protein
MAFDPVDANTIYLGLEHVWKSSDRGSHWHKTGINEDIAARHRTVKALRVAPSDARTLYAFADVTRSLWISRDGGETWSPGFQVAAPTVLAVSPRDARTVYLGSSYGLYVSRDGGESGQLLDAFPPLAGVHKIVIDPADPARLFVGSNDGVLVSADAGASWSRLSSDRPGERPTGSVVDLALADGTLYASSNQGIWSMDLSGRAPCEQKVRVTPSVLAPLGSAGGELRFDVDAVPGCPWTAAGVSWARLEAGPASADLRIDANAGATRQATLIIAGQRVQLTQYGGADPITDGATVSISNAGRCVTSAGGNSILVGACAGTTASQQFVLQHRRDLLYRALSAGSGNCLDMTRQRPSGVMLYQYQCHGDDQQLFQFLPHADGSFAIFTSFGMQCLEVRGEHLEQQACNGGDAQKFRIK